MSFDKDQSLIIIKRYVEDFDSLEMIAKDYNTYVNKIRRFLIRNNVPIRSNAESQKYALSVGRNQHPTLGKKRTEEEKSKISSGVSKAWENMPDEKREEFKKGAKERWEKLSPEERDELNQSAKKGMQKAAADGSKMEKYLHHELESLGIPIIFHKKGLVGNPNLEVDIFIPSYNTAVEIDGPTHFFPIFGEERLEKTMESDKQKIGLLVRKGISILRVKHISKNASLSKAKKIVAAILEFLDYIGTKEKAELKEIEV